MYAKLQTHTNIVESRMQLRALIIGCVAATTEILVAGKPSKKGATCNMAKRGFFDGWFYSPTFQAGTSKLVKIEIEPPGNRDLLTGLTVKV